MEFLQERRSRKRLGGCVRDEVLSVDPPKRIICCIGLGSLSNECLDELDFVECARDSCVAWDNASTEEERFFISCEGGSFAVVVFDVMWS